ncbi:hypothetical protein AAII07_25260 [Microvirga sp. 0TCS3.31]
MARSRLNRFLAQALLGLLLFTWLPAMGQADFAVLDDLGHAFSVAEAAEGAAADDEGCPDTVEDGNGVDDVIPMGLFCRSMDDGLGHGWRPKVLRVIDASGHPGVPQATGPPSLSN